MRTPRLVAVSLSLALVGVIGACGSSESGGSTRPSASPTASAAAQFPDVEKAELSRGSDGTYSLAVTMTSPYDSPSRYADGWRVLQAGTDTVLATMMLDHDHASEQPFTRSQTRLTIPDGVEKITVEGHDQVSGYGGATVTVAVSG